MLLRIYSENPNHDRIRKVVEVLEAGEIIIYPTDTVYAMGCDIKAHIIEKITNLKGLIPES